MTGYQEPVKSEDLGAVVERRSEWSGKGMSMEHLVKINNFK